MDVEKEKENVHAVAVAMCFRAEALNKHDENRVIMELAEMGIYLDEPFDYSKPGNP